MSNEAQNPVVTPEQLEFVLRLERIFMPHTTRQRREMFKNEAKESRARFIHYTSAEAALSIIKSKRIWMRNTICMSDYSEVQHGFDIFSRFFAAEANRTAFIGALDQCVSGVAQEGINLFNQWWNDTRFNTYVTSVSEHSETEDLYGRLSMWRAFGGNVARVGIVFNIPWFSTSPLTLHLLFSPVAYLTEASAHKVLLEVIENIRANREFLCTVERPQLLTTVFFTLVAGVVCLKHEGFHEEREWRAIYAPKRWPSSIMESSTEVVAGVPQPVCKIPLDASVSDSLVDLELSKMFDRLIIGPTQYPWPMYEAFVSALTEVGITDAEKRVFASTIPIRT